MLIYQAQEHIELFFYHFVSRCHEILSHSMRKQVISQDSKSFPQDSKLYPQHTKSFVKLASRYQVFPIFIYLFGVLRRFQHCTGHITMGSWKGRGNQYIQFIRVLYCKLPTNGKQLPAFPLEAVPGTEPQPQRWEARVLPLCHRGP